MSDSNYVDPNPRYWQQYSNLQQVKHALIREYLNGWFPKLGFWAGRILYIDTHAGRGRHETGHLGSPLVAYTTFTAHGSRDRILAKSEMRFVFIERDQRNASALQRELEELERVTPRPPRVHVEMHVGDSTRVLEDAVQGLRAANQRIAPSFVFVDPYGFKVSCLTLRRLMEFERVELFLNIMWRPLYMGLRHARHHLGWASTMDFIFGSSVWRDRITCANLELCAHDTIALVSEVLGARWVTPIRMLGQNKVTRYLLVHFTNHDVGRDLMKEVRWKVCPSYDGTFVARKGVDARQLPLGLSPEPDWHDLRGWVMDQVRARPIR
jgi:three-Cys-motif partner protein